MNLTADLNTKLDVLYKRFLDYVQSKTKLCAQEVQEEIYRFHSQIKYRRFPNIDEMTRGRLVSWVLSSKIKGKKSRKTDQ